VQHECYCCSLELVAGLDAFALAKPGLRSLHT
jgi:hypothetical protein